MQTVQSVVSCFEI